MDKKSRKTGHFYCPEKNWYAPQKLSVGNTMRKLIGKAGIAITVLIALYLLILWTQWLPLSTAAGENAVAIMTKPLPPIPEKDNAFSEAWLFPYDIPAADKAKVMAADIERFSKYDRSYDSKSSADGKYPQFSDSGNLLCKPKTENCLDKARANLDKYRALFSENEKLSAKAVLLANFNKSRSLFTQNIAMPLPSYGVVGSWQLSLSAFWHVEGRKAEALDLTCRAAESWRGFAENSHGLIDQLLGLAFYANATRLLAEQLSENPRDMALPASCAEAYSSVMEKKFPICHSMQLEYQMLQSATASIKEGESGIAGEPVSGNWSDKLASLWFNERASEEKFALPLAAECSDDAEILQAIKQHDEGIWSGLSLCEMAFNPVGGILTSISSSNYSDYRERMQNLKLTQAAMQAVLAQRDIANSATGNDEISAGNVQVRFNKQAKAFEVDLYRSLSENQLLSLPLAGSRLEK